MHLLLFIIYLFMDIAFELNSIACLSAHGHCIETRSIDVGLECLRVLDDEEEHNRQAEILGGFG